MISIKQDNPLINDKDNLSYNDIKEALTNTINDQIAAYGTDSGWTQFNKETIKDYIEQFINESTDEELNEFEQNMDGWFENGDRLEIICHYFDEWMWYEEERYIQYEQN